MSSPAASQVAIKQLGINGGGVFNVNGAHPFENPNAITNLLTAVAINVMGWAAFFAFGRTAMAGRDIRALAAAALADYRAAGIVTVEDAPVDRARVLVTAAGVTGHPVLDAGLGKVDALAGTPVTAAVAAMRAASPLVHGATGSVTRAIVADGLLAAGARPMLTETVDEAPRK